jgi:hypothetical protein
MYFDRSEVPDALRAMYQRSTIPLRLIFRSIIRISHIFFSPINVYQMVPFVSVCTHSLTDRSVLSVGDKPHRTGPTGSRSLARHASGVNGPRYNVQVHNSSAGKEGTRNKVRGSPYESI